MIVEHKSCKNESQLKSYYTRLGVQLFLTYFLGTKDLHCENLIASGEYPVLIDLETLVHIQYNRERPTINDVIYYQLSGSVLYTGILPYYGWNKDGHGVNSSAISGKGGEMYPFKIPVITNPETSEMKIGYHYPRTEETQSLAMLNDQFYEPIKYMDEITDGFTSAYKQVMFQKEEFGELVKELSKTKSRYLLVDTQRYGMLLSSSYHPSLFDDGAKREIFLNAIWRGRKGENKEVVDSEVLSMLQGDIPYFSYHLDSLDLLSSHGQIISNYFKRTAIEELYDKLDFLDLEDMDKQCEYIKVSLELVPENEDGLMNRVYAETEKSIGTNYGQESVDRHLERLKARILSYAVWNEAKTEVSWFSSQLSAYGSFAWDIKAMDMYLYNGLAGMLLLMYTLKCYEENGSVENIFIVLRQMLFQYTQAGLESLENLHSSNTGAYQGESSLIYVYMVLHQLSGEEMYLEYAKKHAGIVEQLLEKDINFDLLSGNAGAAQVFLLLNQITKEKQYIKLAKKAIELLWEKREIKGQGVGWTVEKNIPPMAGMAHGNSGILMPISWLRELTGMKKYENMVKDILDYEESRYNPYSNNWEDVREEHNGENSIGAVAWCHGAAGILISRVFCCEKLKGTLENERMKRDIQRAFDKTKSYWKRDSSCLCHGSLGNLWVLESTGETLIKDKYNIPELCFLSQERLNPGLLSGYGGVLYYLLKTKGVEIPNILKLEI